MNDTLACRLEEIYKSGRDFAAFRLPHSNKIKIITNNQEEKSELIYDMENLNGKTGYVIAPFSISKENPCILLPSTHEEEHQAPHPHPSTPIPPAKPDIPNPSADYRSRYTTFITAIKEKTYRKIVLSRNRTIECEAYPAIETFLSACRYYPGLYIYIYNAIPAGIWLGCSPEPLLTGEYNRMQTVAIASTHLPGMEKTWSNKDIDEQSAVSEHIKTRLDAAGIKSQSIGPYPQEAGHLTHLRTDFNFSLTNPRKLGSILKSLHPTPAISGLPQSEAVEFILKHEGYDRRYYSGFLGTLQPNGRSNIYINLRCMSIEKHHITLYAGGGLLSSSTLEAEWKETEEKLRTITSIPSIYVFK